MQLDIIPCNVRRFQPFPKQETANALGYALGEDGLKYIVKSNNINPLVCANEWVCTSLAEFLHIPVAPSKILQMPNGDLVFGTAVQFPALSDLDAAQLLLSHGARNDISSPELSAVLSSTYTFDLFIGNYDRHVGNFIFSLESVNNSHGKIARVRAIDYDAAQLLENAEFQLPLSKNSNTVSVGRQIRQVHGFDMSAAETILDRIRKGRTVMVERAMVGMPEQWLSTSKRNDLYHWVNTNHFDQKLQRLAQGISDGTYL